MKKPNPELYELTLEFLSRLGIMPKTKKDLQRAMIKAASMGALSGAFFGSFGGKLGAKKNTEVRLAKRKNAEKKSREEDKL